MSDFNPPEDEILESVLFVLRCLCWGVAILGSIGFYAVIRHAWAVIG